ncbi:MAG: hypothetical protein OEV23_07545 [Gallionella sp.]|nr:hypothetical protein [Gallionella sp.]
MKAFGYPNGQPLNKYGLVKLKEVSISADVETIRSIAKFLLDAAEEMEQLGERYDHVHMQDKCSAWKDSWPDIVIAKPINSKT